MVSFLNIPDSRMPFMWVEFDNSAAISSRPSWKTLIIGYKLNTGTAKVNSPVLVSSEKQASEFFGEGSLLHQQFEAYKKNDAHIETWGIALPDPAGATAAKCEIAFTKADDSKSFGAGIIQFEAFGKKITTAIQSQLNNASEIVSQIISEINSNERLEYSASAKAGAHEDLANSATLILTTKHNSSIYNGYKFEINNSSLPSNLIVPENVFFAGGVGEPDISELFKTIKDERFQSFVSPFYSKDNLKIFSDVLGGRWGAAVQNDGVLFVSTCLNSLSHSIYSENFASLNSEHIMHFNYANCKSPAYLVNAAIAAQISKSASIDPAMPLQTLPLFGIIPPNIEDRQTSADRQTFLNQGISTVTTVGEQARIERAITTYKLNASGIPDESYLSAEKIFTLSFIRFDIKNYFWGKYSRFKLANNGTNFGKGQKVMTPNLAKAEVASRFMLWEEMGLVQDSKQFVDNLIVERNPNNPGRLDFLLPPKLMDQLVQASMQIQFR